MCFRDLFSLTLEEADRLRGAVEHAAQRIGATEPTQLLAIENAVLQSVCSGQFCPEDVDDIATAATVPVAAPLPVRPQPISASRASEAVALPA
jgi:hypothetical protein